MVEDATLPARPPRPLPLVPLVRLVRTRSLGELVATGWSFWLGAPRVRVCADSGEGEGSLSLIGLISLDEGATGDLRGRTEPGVSISFHFVEDEEVTIGVGLGGR